jgi:ATP-dependent Clp protease ATP-binding subunit ClpA
MFDRLSGDGRRALDLAQAESRSLRHNYLGTEHIVIGIARETTGTGGRALRRTGFDASRARDDIIRLIGIGTVPGMEPGDDLALRSIGIHLDEVRRRTEEAFGPGALNPRARRSRRGPCTPPYGWCVAPRVKIAMQTAAKEAERMRVPCVGTEHVLLGMLQLGEGVGMQLLDAQAIDKGRLASYLRQPPA